MPSRWDAILDQKPRPLVDHLLQEVAKRVASLLEAWPLEIESLDPATGLAFAPLLEPDAPRPGRAVYAEAFRLARWELQRDLPAIDAYMRNLRYLERGVAPGEKRALLFLTRWLVEQMVDLLEATENRVQRAQLVACLEVAERRLFAPVPRA